MAEIRLISPFPNLLDIFFDMKLNNHHEIKHGIRNTLINNFWIKYLTYSPLLAPFTLFVLHLNTR